ncbi:DUF2147 domain-containing protein [Flavobacterium johnsoniae]|uniref:DUF2147 domain-containing protein n=1 Tax=Flavobacterium johnsoniae TaxID=986 RepID=UPI0025AFE9BD|nr:DUF2147 domain-containing protein [Flavobacterium johnsoniae]WJS93334.1 DUF2147 domain-containing protein [Flavobacterium johnsoniae]
MKTAKILFLILLAVASKMQAQVNEKSIVGVWESDKKDVRMEFFKDGANYSAKLLWGNLVVEKDGITSKKDSKNPDVRLRSRNILGITSLTGLEWNGKEYTNGKIYDPPSGDTYTCKAWIEDGKLNLRGYLGISLLGKTVTWHRYK